MRKYISNITPERSSLVLQTSVLMGYEQSGLSIGIRLEAVSGYEDFWDSIINSGLIYINGVKYSEPDARQPFIVSDTHPYIFTIRLDSTASEIPQGLMEAVFFKDGVLDETGTISVSVSASDVRKTSAYTREGFVIDSSMSSFMLMRTNPKLTGNIKLVVTSDDKLYLDTVKVSDALNDRVYRKYPVSSEGNYPFDVKTVFSRLP